MLNGRDALSEIDRKRAEGMVWLKGHDTWGWPEGTESEDGMRYSQYWGGWLTAGAYLDCKRALGEGKIWSDFWKGFVDKDVAAQTEANLKAGKQWDDRWGWTTKLDWQGRYYDAVGLTDTAKEVFILADPYYKPDFDQVSRIEGDNITWLHTPFMGHQLPNAFVVMNIMKDMLYAAAGGTLTPELFYKLFRARNDLPRYQHDLLMEAERRGKIKSAIRVCEYTLKKRNAVNIRRTLGKLREQLAEMERKEAAE